MAGALEGIKILEFARVAPGAFCTMMLGDMGAEVIKVETPPDTQGKQPTGSGISPDKADARLAAFNHLNRNKQSIALNLRTDEGRSVLHRLIESSDVIVDGFRPGAMKRLGADYEAAKAINPRLIYCSLSGFGSTGPYRHLPGHDINYLSFGGALNLIGNAGQLPTVPLNLIADYASASLHGVIGILFAIIARQNTGKGQYVDISFLDGVISLTAAIPGLWRYFLDGSQLRRGEHWLSGVYPYYACYETKDGKVLTLGCVERHFWENLCTAIGREDLIPCQLQPSHSFHGPDESLRRAMEELRAVFATRTRDEWFDFLAERDICIGKVYSWDEVFADPQVIERAMLLEIDDPEAGSIRQVGIPIKLSDTPGTVRSLSPYLGQHSAEILARLGYSATEITSLQEQRVVV